MVNNHRSKWLRCDSMRMTEEAGLTVCDLFIKARTGPTVSNKWETYRKVRQ